MAKFEDVWGQILAKTWQDDEYRKTVQDDPGKALADEGITVPEGIAISVLPVQKPAELHNSVVVLPFPERPKGYDLASPPPPPPGGNGGGGGGCSCSSILCCCCCP